MNDGDNYLNITLWHVQALSFDISQQLFESRYHLYLTEENIEAQRYYMKGHCLGPRKRQH